MIYPREWTILKTQVVFDGKVAVSQLWTVDHGFGSMDCGLEIVSLRMLTRKFQIWTVGFDRLTLYCVLRVVDLGLWI